MTLYFIRQVQLPYLKHKAQVWVLIWDGGGWLPFGPFTNLKQSSSAGTIKNEKNLGQLWLAYTEPQGDYYMLQLISVGSLVSSKDASMLWHH